jgi:transposase InsO family protein
LRGPVELGQYTSADFTDALDDHGILASLGSVGDAYDTHSKMPILDAVGWV